MLCILSIVISFHSGFFLFQTGPLASGEVFLHKSIIFSAISFAGPLAEGTVAPHLHSIYPLSCTPLRSRAWDPGGRVLGGLETCPSSHSYLLTSPHCPPGLCSFQIKCKCMLCSPPLAGASQSVPKPVSCLISIPARILTESLVPPSSLSMLQFLPLSPPRAWTAVSQTRNDGRNRNAPALLQCFSVG